MTHVNVHFQRLAAREYRLANAWYAARSPSAAKRFRQEIKRVIDRIAQAADQGAIYRGPYRWMRLHRFPYVLYYAALDPTKVIVYAVAHSARRPGYWLRRTRA